MLFDVSKALGKSFFFGAFLPTFFLTTNVAAAIVLAVGAEAVIKQIGFTSITLLCLAAAFFIATAFWSLNIWVVRFYEGYPILRCQFIRKRVQSRRDKLYREIAALRAKSKGKHRVQTGHEDYLLLTELQVKAEVEYPPVNTEPLPSKLGNIIRAFECYPATRYNIETITIWPRLLAVLPKSRIDAIDNEKSFMDFWLNFSLAILVSSLFWAAAMWYTAIIFWPFPILICIGGILLWYLFYRLAIPSAISWGYEVRTAFDLYRSDLLRKLGVERPTSLVKERGLWDKIFWFFTYEDYTKRKGLPFSKLPTQKNRKKP